MLAAVAAVVLVPLAREYAELRAGSGLGPAAAFLTTLLVVPALGLGIAVSLPLAAYAPAQWTVTVAVALGAYSLAVRTVLKASSAGTAPSRSTLG